MNTPSFLYLCRHSVLLSHKKGAGHESIAVRISVAPEQRIVRRAAFFQQGDSTTRTEEMAHD